jgi:hypothetical protein
MADVKHTVHSVEAFGNEETGFDITQVHGSKGTVDIDGLTDDEILVELSKKELLFGHPKCYVIQHTERGMEVLDCLTGEPESLIVASEPGDTHH